MIKNFFIFTIIHFLIVSIVSSDAMAQQSGCTETRDRCIKTVETQYKECSKNCDPDDPLINKAWCAGVKGYKPGSSKYLECIEEQVKSCREKICRKDYTEGMDFCWERYKKCRKGDIFGKVTMEISWSKNSVNEIVEGNAHFTIMGFWKYKPEESHEFVKSYRPEGLQMMTVFKEKINDKYPAKGCPSLRFQHQGGGARVLTVDPNVDYLLNSCGRLSIINMPSKPPEDIAKFLPEEIKKLYGPIYQVGFCPGKVIEVEGIECAASNFPECLKYNKSIGKVTFGQFIISDDFKKGKMSGSESWISCSDDYKFNEGDIGFEIAKDKITISGEGKPNYDPLKAEGGCANGTEKIRVYWKFDLIE